MSGVVHPIQSGTMHLGHNQQCNTCATSSSSACSDCFMEELFYSATLFPRSVLLNECGENGNVTLYNNNMTLVI